MYHSVQLGVRKPDWTWAIGLADFRDHLDLLQDKGWHVARLSELASSAALPPRSVAITFDDGYADNIEAVSELHRRGMCATFFVVSQDIGRLASWRQAGAIRQMLSVEQLRNVAAAGMEIGSHTRTHCYLTRVEPKRLHEELEGSKTDLENILGQPIDSFAYPYGDFDDRVAAAVQHVRYRLACTARSGFACIDRDPFRIRRVTVFAGDGVPVLARKLAFAANDVSWNTVMRYAWHRLRDRLRVS